MGLFDDKKVNWNKGDEKETKSKEKVEDAKTDNSKEIAKTKAEITKCLLGTMDAVDKLYALEPTSTLSSIQISLSLLFRETKKLNNV